MSTKSIFLLCTMLLFCNLYAQKTPALSKEQMYEDYDQFVQLITNYNPQLDFRKLETGYDALSFLVERKGRIDAVQEYGEFVAFMKYTLNTLHDIHTNMIESDKLLRECRDYFTKRMLTPFDSINFKNSIQEYVNYWMKKPSIIRSFGNYIEYLDGRYYTQGTLTFSNENGENIAVEQCELIFVNELSPDSFMLKSPECLLEPLRWDYVNNKYYTLSFPVVSGQLVFRNIKNEIICIDLSKYPILSLTNGIEQCQLINPSVFYFKGKKILYISMPSMSQSKCLFNDLVRKYKGKEIESIVIDVRNNAGGSDQCWTRLIQSLYPDTIKMPCRIAFKKKFSPNMADTGCLIDYDSTMDLYARDLQWNYFKPNDENLGFDGTLYIIQNQKTYSAAHSLSSICKLAENWTSVGVPTGYIGGRGCGPYYFQLKNSGFLFSMECDLDMTYGANDLLFNSDAPEIIVTSKTTNHFRRFDNNIANKPLYRKYRLRYDPYFRAVMKMIKETTMSKER